MNFIFKEFLIKNKNICFWLIRFGYLDQIQILDRCFKPNIQLSTGFLSATLTKKQVYPSQDTGIYMSLHNLHQGWASSFSTINIRDPIVSLTIQGWASSHQHQRSNCFLDISRMSFLFSPPSTSDIKLFPSTFHGCCYYSLHLPSQAFDGPFAIRHMVLLLFFHTTVTINAGPFIHIASVYRAEHRCADADLWRNMLQDVYWMIYWNNPFQGFFFSNPCGM